ncbi:MAG TPA: hypothetical protein VKN63_02385 [Afifellaceae bacterium]|nr:hypothetical protein [Afifellaceae bacterium]
MVALACYLALMTQTCLSLSGAKGPVIVEGPFAANDDYCRMLAALRPEGVHTARSATGTSVGCALLVLNDVQPPETRQVRRAISQQLKDYARNWYELTATRGNS